jgi:hypothetical protein
LHEPNTKIKFKLPEDFKCSLQINASCRGVVAPHATALIIRPKTAPVKERGVNILPRASSSFQTPGSHSLAPHATVSSLASTRREAQRALRSVFLLDAGGMYDTDSCRRQAIVDASKAHGTSDVEVRWRMRQSLCQPRRPRCSSSAGGADNTIRTTYPNIYLRINTRKGANGLETARTEVDGSDILRQNVGSMQSFSIRCHGRCRICPVSRYPLRASRTGNTPLSLSEGLGLGGDVHGC